MCARVCILRAFMNVCCTTNKQHGRATTLRYVYDIINITHRGYVIGTAHCVTRIRRDCFNLIMYAINIRTAVLL